MSRQKSWNDAIVRLDLVPCFETWTIAELDVVFERKVREVKHAKSLTRQLEGKQVSQVGTAHTSPTKDIHNIVDHSSSVTITRRWNVSSTL
jgi:hypothetical protein